MTKEEVFQELQKAIFRIEENFNAEEREYYLDDPLKENNFPFNYSIEAGISKAVILIEGAHFVIKMPFFKIYDDDGYSCDKNDWNYNKSYALHSFIDKRKGASQEEIIQFCQDWEESNPMPENYDDNYYYDICGASSIHLGEEVEPAIPDWDYCRLESVIYQLAVEEGLGAYFAEEAYLGTIDTTPIYYQTRCTPMTALTIDYNSKEYQKKKKHSEKICKKLNIVSFNDIWVSDFIMMYGEEEFKRLYDFLAKYDIGDLRTCNIGYLDGAPILFDYSGYRDW